MELWRLRFPTTALDGFGKSDADLSRAAERFSQPGQTSRSALGLPIVAATTEVRGGR